MSKVEIDKEDFLKLLNKIQKIKFVSLRNAYKMQCIILGKSMVISMKLLTKLYYITIRKQDV